MLGTFLLPELRLVLEFLNHYLWQLLLFQDRVIYGWYIRHLGLRNGSLQCEAVNYGRYLQRVYCPQAWILQRYLGGRKQVTSFPVVIKSCIIMSSLKCLHICFPVLFLVWQNWFHVFGFKLVDYKCIWILDSFCVYCISVMNDIVQSTIVKIIARESEKMSVI